MHDNGPLITPRARRPRRAAGRGPSKPGPSSASSRGRSTEHATQLKDLPALVVDDDSTNAKLVAVLLRSEGCDVRVAGSAEEALAILETFHPRVIVLDLVLPLMSGLLLAQKLKAESATREIVLIAVTAFNGLEAERVAREAGCAAYIRKPIDALSFTQMLLTHLGGPQ